MPNQLATSKRRQSLAEHEAVLAAVAALARREDTTVMAVLRRAVREWVRARAAEPAHAEELRAAVWAVAPRPPATLRTPAQAARFKRRQREFDRLVLDLGLDSPATVQARNSAAPARQAVRLIDFDSAHVAAGS